MFFTVELRELVWVREMYQYTEERMIDSINKSALYTTAAEWYARWSGTAFFAKRAPKIAEVGYAALLRDKAFAQAAEDVFQSLDYLAALPRKSFRDFLQLMH